jgi:HAD superfamily hydrolase (TIGR01509 family)
MDRTTAPGARIRAVFWDNDGVLVDTERLYFEATRRTLAGASVDLTEALYHDLFLVEARGAWHLAEAAGASPGRVAELKGARDRLYVELLRGGDHAIPGVRDALAALAGKLTMAVVTSSHREPFEVIHARTGLLRFFDFVLVREDYTRSKPDPEPYLAAVARAGVDPRECLVVEDSERGLRAAVAAGLRCWVVPTALTRAGDFSAADRVLASIADVARALDTAPR